MGMDLMHNDECVHYNRATWSWILNMARNFGWEPQGTLPPFWFKDNGIPAEDWDIMDYFHNDGQYVQDSDACAIESALEEALKNFPDGYSQVYPFISEEREILQEFVKFCHDGGFLIA